MNKPLPRSRPFVTDVRIVAELYKALERLGAEPDLLQIVGSWGDTQDDDWVLASLVEWNLDHRPAKEDDR